ncbi:MAG: DUF1697 domain-containing protein [Pseudomonadota bacterium]|nr:DUF1697 domain-containing protein [Pseudomonadota bacterium]
MTAYVALLRAVNVAGTGKLPMAELKAMGEACGFKNVRTFIASGNLLFESDAPEADVRATIEQKLEAFFGRPVPVFVRSAKEMAEVAQNNPFGDDKPSRVMAHFITVEPTQAMLAEARDVQGERMTLGQRMIYVSYGEGIGKTRLKLPAVKQGTARNMSSVAKMAELMK